MTSVNFRSARSAAIGVLLGSLASNGAANTVFKWVDDKGVVNYATAPPPAARNLVAINATPAIVITGSQAGDEEARYWRERRLRESLRDTRDDQDVRLRRETEELRQVQIRHQMQLTAQSATSDEQRLRQAREQCLRERRIDCDGGGGISYYPAPIVVRAAPRQSIRQVAPFPVNGGVSVGIAPGTIAGTQAQLAQFRANGFAPVTGYSLRTR